MSLIRIDALDELKQVRIEAGRIEAGTNRSWYELKQVRNQAQDELRQVRIEAGRIEAGTY